MNKEPPEQPIVLIVEDEYLLAFDLATSFEDYGLTVLGPASTIERALALITEAEEIDCAVLDVSIRDEMVFPVARVLSERGIPFVFTTGYEKSVFAGEFPDVEIYTKPLDIGRVTAEISALAHGRSARRHT